MNLQEAYRTPKRLDQKRNFSCHIIIKTSIAQIKERILKAVRVFMCQVTHKDRLIRIKPDFSLETLKAEDPGQPRLLYPAEVSITIDRETKIFHDKNQCTEYLSTNPPFQRTINGKLQHKVGTYTPENARK